MEWFYWIIVIGLTWISWKIDPLLGIIVLPGLIGIRIAIAFFRWIVWGGEETQNDIKLKRKLN